MFKDVESIITTVLLIAALLLVVTHAGGFATDTTALGDVGDNTLGILSGGSNSAGVNYPTGTSPFAKGG